MWKCRAVISIVIAMLFLPAIAWANPKPSFDCAKASSFAEKAICSNDELAQLDVRMSKAYKAQLAATSNITSAKAAQRAWVKKREACGSVACIRTLYAARIPELGGGIVVAAAKSTSEQSETYVVANTQPPDDYLSLRSDPSVSVGKRIAKMPNGTELRLLQGNLEGWARVEIVATGQKGWAFAGTDTTKYIVLRPTTTTAESTTSSASEPAGFFVVASLPAPNDYVWLRSDPSVSSGKQITKLASGTAMEVLDRSKGAWLRVKVVETGKEGWVFSGSDSTKYVIWKTKAAIAAEAAEEKAKQAAIEKAAAEAKAAKLAADQARVAAAEAAKKAPIIAEISAALGNPDPADLLLFVNEGGDVPNLAKNLDGQLVSATGKLSVCHTEIASPYAGARGQRYGKLVADFLNTALPSGAEPSSVDLEHCGSQTPVDVVYFQLGQLEAAPLKFVQYLGKSLNASLKRSDEFSVQDAENAEAAIVAAQQKAIEDKIALKKNTLENIRSGTADGFGFVIATGKNAPLCYFDGGELSAVMDENIEPVLQQLLYDDAIYAEVNKLNNSLKPLNSLDEIYIGMTRKPSTCGWMFGDRTSLQKIAAAMDRDGIAFDTVPYWATAEDIVPLIDAAKIEQQTMAEAKAAQEAEAALAAEKQAAEERAAQQKEAAEKAAAETKEREAKLAAEAASKEAAAAAQAAAAAAEEERRAQLPPFKAYITCLLNGDVNNLIPAWACMKGMSNSIDGYASITNFGQQTDYTPAMMVQNFSGNVVEIELSQNFDIRLQANGETYNILNLEIRDRDDKVVFQRQASQFKVISVSNNAISSEEGDNTNNNNSPQDGVLSGSGPQCFDRSAASAKLYNIPFSGIGYETCFGFISAKAIATNDPSGLDPNSQKYKEVAANLRGRDAICYQGEVILQAEGGRQMYYQMSSDPKMANTSDLLFQFCGEVANSLGEN